MLIGFKPYERQSKQKRYRNGYWKRWIVFKDGRLEIRMPRIRGIKYESGIILRYLSSVS
ncbi:MAG: transposase [Thermodesulfovibrionales bacterium]|nr:transposase [Thermodesulfovibrionales bacterium]